MKNRAPSQLIRYSLCFLLILGISTSQAQFNSNAGTDASICKGDSTIVGGNPIASGGMTPYNYTWTPNYNISATNISHPSVWPDSSITYFLSVGDANGRSAVDSIRISVGQRPVVTMGSLPDMCFEDKKIKLTQGNPTGGYYISAGSPDSLYFDPSFSGMGTFKVSYYYFDAICQYTDSASENITIHRSPRVTISPIYDTICLGDSLTLQGHGADNYTWNSSFPINPLSGDSLITAIPDITGSIQLIGTNLAGACQDSISMYIVVNDCGVGIGTINTDDSIELFPNPAHQFITLRSSKRLKYHDVEILDESGQVVLNWKWHSPNETLDISALAEGFYILKFSDNRKPIPFIKVD